MRPDDERLMGIALGEAALAAAEGEIPVGACVVRDGVVLGRGHNRREADRDPLGHAEIAAIRAAAAALGSWRLDGCTLYVTLEPCPMCAGAILNARISRVVYGARDPKAGAMGSVCDLTAMPFPAVPYVKSGVRAADCQAELDRFFRRLRQDRRNSGDFSLFP